MISGLHRDTLVRVCIAPDSRQLTSRSCRIYFQTRRRTRTKVRKLQDATNSETTKCILERARLKRHLTHQCALHVLARKP